ncbi:TetR/AcrR family transcriptional regulator [Sphingobacterium bambusae]|uniref:TetR/AcrR family transcriptional regulator n=1 Tax=Sphingobacterium bambusae TaxID=662858 RepID=A0ABW6BKC6_9SPHI|nr:TetR/AcrR family transcriptional regulator [Sphingobacterium bambusae]WPL49477.1 TetR/AcrR family transcriptional regulator [Sphingobacterium bambusae]
MNELKYKNKNRKVVDGPMRNKQRSKAKILTAVGAILRDQGHSSLTITNISKVMEMNAKLIYLYFGSVDELIKTYVDSKNYWNQLENNEQRVLSDNTCNSTRDIVMFKINNIIEFFSEHKDFLALLVWDLVGAPNVLKTFSCEKRKYFSTFFKNEVAGRDENCKLESLDILISSVITMSLYARNGRSWMGISLNEPSDRQRIIEKLWSIINYS